MEKRGNLQVIFVEPLSDKQLQDVVFLSTPLPVKVGSAEFDFQFNGDVHHSDTEPATFLGEIIVKDIFSSPQKPISTGSPENDTSYDVFSHE